MEEEIPYIYLYEKMYLIRMFETRLLELFEKGKIFGTTHTYVGQEAIAVSAIENLRESDIVFSNHRCHGHYLAKEDDPKGLLAEIMGKEGGTCSGRGGSQHLCKNNFFSNGIQGGYLPNALGMAFAEKYNNTGNIVVAFIGDGTLGEGVVYETLNLASLWEVPLLIVVENNRYAQTTPIDKNLAGSMLDRVKAFNISNGDIESNDVFDLYPRFKKIIDEVRSNGKPHVEIIHTYRLNAHSKGDDFRDIEEIESWRKKDPLFYVKQRISNEEVRAIETQVNTRLNIIEKEVDNLPFTSINPVEL
jgi:TPP-dependent pyruvate/acetoin dehydrogenase alpha subunit